MNYKNFSHELLLVPFQNGVQLEAPTYKNAIHYSSLAQMSDVVYNTFFYDLQNRTQFVNNANIKMYSCDRRDLLNKQLYGVISKKDADIINRNNNLIMACECLQVYKEQLTNIHNEIYYAISFKIPLYQHGRLIGLFGTAVIENNGYDLAWGIAQIMSLGIFSSVKKLDHRAVFSIQNNSMNLTLREAQCLRFIKMGYTTKMIAKQLGLSQRTIEDYITSLKEKFGVTRKHELITVDYEN